MCKYCKHVFDGSPYKPILRSTYKELYCFDLGICREEKDGKVNGVLTPSMYINDGPDIFNTDIPILYCPICGAKLHEN